MSSSDGNEELVVGERDFPEVGSAESASALDRIIGWLTYHGELAGNTLVDSSVYLSFIAMTEVAIAMVILSLPPSPAPVLGALVTFSVYTNDHLSDEPDESRRSAFVDRHRGALYALASLTYGVAVTVSVLGGPLALTLTLLPGIFWVLYASGRIPAIGLQIRRLKETLIVNSTLVATAWAVSLTFVPMAFADVPLTPTVAIVFGYFFLRSLADTIVPNVRDSNADRRAGVATIPIAFGIERTRHVLYGIDLLTATVVCVATVAGLLPGAIAFALLVGVGYSLSVAYSVGRTRDDELRAIAAEFEYIVVGIALVPVVYGV